jgi:hypothetical protein
MFVTYDCGCIGLPPGADGRALIIRPCDGDQDYGAFERTMHDNGGSPPRRGIGRRSKRSGAT